MTAARLLADQITGKHNDNAEVFSPQRFFHRRPAHAAP